MTDDRTIALMEELDCSAELIESGLGAMRALSLAEAHYHTLLFLLTHGFERFLKVALCLAYLRDHGGYPTEREFVACGWRLHSPRTLLEKLLTAVDQPSLGTDAVFAMALDETTTLGRLVKLLHEHAEVKEGRYHMLDVVLGNRPLGKGRDGVSWADSPADAWQRLETDVMTQMGLLNELGGPQAGAAAHVVFERCADCLGWLAWAVTMLFTQRALGPEAMRFSPRLHPFLYMHPELKDIGLD